MESKKNLSKMIKTFRPNNESICRMFCFPFAGGSASFYGEWSTILSRHGIEVCAIQLPGREDRIYETLLTNVDELASEVVEAMADYQDKPFVFFGHSMGTLICFEVARKLRAMNRREASILFISSGKAPQISPRRILHDLPKDDFLRKIKELGGTPDIIIENRDLSELYLPILRADFTLIETYQYVDSTPFQTKIVGYGGKMDKEVRYEDIVAWERHSHKPLPIKIYDGDHFYLRPYKESLLADIVTHVKMDLHEYFLT
ncbi:thioesterase II family protein [Paucisalibacillus globulus]|uniref:thioesterase II family protein n=1 Tax=Paucisalibacillus globulus TaxID=351095 RepID=UPI00041E2B42|nr:alpha/beta fold hydrolase [Paucisalibacillus globulus]